MQVLVPDRPALVLGSTQPEGTVHGEEARRHGLALVRRRSGGGAVLVGPDDPLWVDVDLPADDPLATVDVSASFGWLGRAWADVLGAAGHDAHVRRGAYDPGRWGARICFAGRGPGEVFVDGRKVVGIAQRRTRAGARFQCAVLRRWDPGLLIDLVLEPDEAAAARRDLATAALGLDLEPRGVVSDLLDRLGAA